MPLNAAGRLVTYGQRLAALSLALLVVGPSVLLVYAWVEVLNNPGYSLVDGYSVGRLPWTAIGIVLALSGSVLGLAFGGLVVAIVGGWWRRLLIAPVGLAAALWWGVAVGVIPLPRFQGPDPVTFAYSLPTAAVLMALLPAALLALLALAPRPPQRPTMRLQPVHPPE